MSRYKICEDCTVRNCKRKPKKVKHGYKCFKKVPIKGGWPMVESALDNTPGDTMRLLHSFGLQLTWSPKKGLRVTRRKKGE